MRQKRQYHPRQRTGYSAGYIFSYSMGSVTVYNPSEEEANIEDCLVVSISVMRSLKDINDTIIAKCSLQLDNGITFDLSMNEVSEIMGNYDYQEDDAYIFWYWYLDDGDGYRNNCLTVIFDDDNMVSNIVITYEGEYRIDYDDYEDYGE